MTTNDLILRGMLNMSQTVQKSRAPKKVSVFFIVFIIIEMLIVAGVAYVFRNDDVTPSVLGYSAFIMDSDNMSDDDPEKGYLKDALVIAEESAPGKNNIGEAVLCENVPGIGSTVMWLKDVVSEGANVDGVVCVTRQNDNKDYELKPSSIIGTVHSYYKTAGKIIKFISKPMGIAACAAAPIALWILIELIVIPVTVRKNKKRAAAHNDYDDEDGEEELTLDDILYGKDDARPLKFDADEQEDETADMADDEDAGEDLDPRNGSDETVALDGVEADEDAQEHGEEVEEEIPEVKHVDVDETVSTTRKAASDSLEELMKMMEDEQKKLNDQLKK